VIAFAPDGIALILPADQGQGGCQAIEDAEALRVVLKGAKKQDVEKRLQIFDQLRLDRVNTVIKFTREMAPTLAVSSEVNHKTTQTYSDYYWSYKMTQEAVEAMRRHGYQMQLVDARTAELSLVH